MAAPVKALLVICTAVALTVGLVTGSIVLAVAMYLALGLLLAIVFGGAEPQPR